MLWSQQVEGEVIGSVVTADLNGGAQDVIVPTTKGARGPGRKHGQPFGHAGTGIGLQNSPLVTDDPNGRVGVTVAGYNARDQGVVEHFELFGSSGADVDGLGAWPMFHHDPQLTGNATAPGVAALAPDPSPSAPPSACAGPAGRPNGYYEVDSGGGVFAYGNVAYCGSLAGARLKYPVVGMAATDNGGGYWLVNSHGEVFSFGDAKFYGPARSLPLKAPVIAMAATPDRRGLLVGGAERPSLRLRRRHVLRAQDGVAPDRADFRHGRDRGRPRLLVGGPERGHVHLRRRRRPQLGQSGPLVAGSSGSPPTRRLRATGWWAPMAPWKPSTLRGSAPSPATGSPTPSRASRRCPGGAGYRLVDTGGELFCYGLGDGPRHGQHGPPRRAWSSGSRRRDHVECPAGAGRRRSASTTSAGANVALSYDEQQWRLGGAQGPRPWPGHPRVHREGAPGHAALEGTGVQAGQRP